MNNLREFKEMEVAETKSINVGFWWLRLAFRPWSDYHNMPLEIRPELLESTYM